MATDSVLGLFQDPAMYQQQRQQEQYNAALGQGVQLAQLDPFQRANALMYTGANQLGGAIGGALGAQDPQMQLMSTRQAILKDYDPNTLEGLQGAAKALRDAGDLQGSYALAQKANETALRESQITKNMREGKAAGTQIKEVGVAEGTREPVYTYQTPSGVYQVVFKTDANGQQQMVPFNGGVDRTTSKTNVGVKMEGESAFLKEMGQLDAKSVNKAMESRTAAIDQMKTLQKMAEVADRPVISGSLAEQRADVSNFFNTIGLGANADRMKTANSQEYIKYSTGLVLDNLKKTGYNPSNADMKVVQSLIPRLENDPIARKQLITYMSDRAKDVVQESARMESYARQNKGLGGYEPKIPQISFKSDTTPSPYSGMSDAELDAAIARAQAAKRK